MSDIWEREGAVELLQKRWGEHGSASRIAVELSQRFRVSVSRNAVIGKLHRLGLTDAARRAGGGPPSRPRPKPAEPRAPREKYSMVKTSGPKIDAARAAMAEVGKAIIEKVVEPPPSSGGKRLMQLGMDDCRYILGNAGGPEDTLYCGEPIGAGPTYCLKHRALAFTAPSSRRA